VPGVRLAATIALGLLMPLAPPSTSAFAQSTREYQIKAAFLFNFGQFVTWQPEALPAVDAPFVIGVLGEDPFGATLDGLVTGTRIGNRPVVVARYDDLADVSGCQILFVSSSDAPPLDDVLEALDGRGILTVGEEPDFAEDGGIIRFLVEENRVRLEINLAAAEAAGLTISSKLLRLADVVGTGRR
jgi:hypothetical protein